MIYLNSIHEYEIQVLGHELTVFGKVLSLLNGMLLAGQHVRAAYMEFNFHFVHAATGLALASPIAFSKALLYVASDR